MLSIHGIVVSLLCANAFGVDTTRPTPPPTRQIDIANETANSPLAHKLLTGFAQIAVESCF